MSATYRVEVGSRLGGIVAWRTAIGFPAFLCEVRELAAEYPSSPLVLVNEDACDYDTDGLTDDEREWIDTAIQLGRQDAVRVANDKRRAAR